MYNKHKKILDSITVMDIHRCLLPVYEHTGEGKGITTKQMIDEIVKYHGLIEIYKEDGWLRDKMRARVNYLINRCKDPVLGNKYNEYHLKGLESLKVGNKNIHFFLEKKVEADKIVDSKRDECNKRYRNTVNHLIDSANHAQIKINREDYKRFEIDLDDFRKI